MIDAKDIDVMFLQEIDTLNFSSEMVTIPGFLTFVDQGIKKRTCTLVRQNIFVNISQISCCGDSPQVWLQVTENSGRKTTLVNLYREWGENQANIIEEFLHNIEKYSDHGNRIMIAGDFNLNPNRTLDKSYSCRQLTIRVLHSFTQLGLDRFSFGDTFSRTVEGKIITSELDWLICNCDVVDVDQERYGLSDHSLLSWKIRGTSEKMKTNKVLLRNLNKIDRDRFARDLSMQPWESLGDITLNVEEMALKFNLLFIQTLDKHAPMKKVLKKKRQTPKPSINLKKLRRQRDNARSKGNILKLRLLRAECNKLSRSEAIDYTKERLRRDDVWKIVNEMLGKTGHSANSNTITDDEGKAIPMRMAADMFNEFFIQKIKKIKNSIPKSKVDPVQGARLKARRLNLPEKCFHLQTVHEKEVEQAIRKSKGSSCPDYYGISPAALKLAPHVVAIPLTYIINTVICNGIIPECWKIAKILPLHKKKAKDKVENYRPVSILPSPSKIMEMIIQAQFTAYFENYGILPCSQFGFRKGLSTIHATGAADHDWKKARQKGFACGALFFDLSAAFDMIDAELLADKLLIYGAGGNVIAWTKSYLSGRRQCVEYSGETSPIVNVTCGSPQGSVISPLLFLILVADIEDWITKAKALSYADDTTVYCAAKEKKEVRIALEKAADEVLSFMQVSMLSANPSKTKFVMFGRQVEDPLRVGDVYIHESKDEVLLGLTVNKSLSWSSHVSSLKMELKKRIGILRRMTFQLPRHIVKDLIQPIFTSKLLYGLALLASAQGRLTENTLLNHLSLFHRQAMKVALGIKKKQGISYSDLLQRTEQKSVFQLALEQLASSACQCLTNEEHPLVKDRLEAHLGVKTTRQSGRTWPPQSTQHSLITKIVEVWERMPSNIRQEKDCLKRKKLIQEWSAHNYCDI